MSFIFKTHFCFCILKDCPLCTILRPLESADENVARNEKPAENQRGQAFVDAGLKDLEDFHFDQPKTLAEADAIRRQLNLENQAVLAQNGYKVAVARASDPAFAAREAAAESLRDGIYKQLAANGMPDAAQLRLDEGSLIKVRNAAQNQIFSGDKVVRSSAQTGPVLQVAKAVTKSGATAAGAAVAAGRERL